MKTFAEPVHSAFAPQGDGPGRPPGAAHSMTNTTTRLLLIGLLALALLPPLFTGIAGVLLERHEARAVADALAWTISQRREDTTGTSLQALLANGAEGAHQWRLALAHDGTIEAIEDEEAAEEGEEAEGGAEASAEGGGDDAGGGGDSGGDDTSEE